MPESLDVAPLKASLVSLCNPRRGLYNKTGAMCARSVSIDKQLSVYCKRKEEATSYCEDEVAPLGR